MDSQKQAFGDEHKEFFKDLGNVVISYTPISGVLDTVKFLHKWVVKKKSHHKIAHHIKRSHRKMRMKYFNKAGKYD
jgi:hypothetical protein